MKISVGVPTYEEQDTIAHTIESLLEQHAVAVQVLVSDRSRNGASLVAIAGRDGDSRLEIRRSKATSALMNFVETGRIMLNQKGNFDAYAFLAGDDWWSPNVAEVCIREMRARDSHIVAPQFGWFGEETFEALPPIGFMQSSASHRQIAVLARALRLQPANLIYAVYDRAAFTDLIGFLSVFQTAAPYASDVGVAMQIISKFQVAHASECRIYRRIDTGVDHAVERLQLKRPEGRANRFRKLAYNRRLVLRDAWRITARLPLPWSFFPLRLLLATVWSIDSTYDFIRRNQPSVIR